MALTAGARLGPYKIVSALGSGGMGEVYKARDTRLDRSVAIKVLPAALSSDAGFRARFDREARAISQLAHPHICTLHDVGIHESTPYLVMELLDGETLADRLVRTPSLPVGDALGIATQIADALTAAHKKGIVHRDLKPGNIFLVRRSGASGAPVAKLLDFGLAKASVPSIVKGDVSLATTSPHPITSHGTILGTFQYMAPEQLEGAEADARSDIFAFGCVLYELLTGKKAFEGQTQASLIAAILEREPTPLATVQPLAPALLDSIVRKCLAKKPDERWQSVADLATALHWVGDAATSPAAMPTAPAARSRSWPRLALVGVAGLVVGAATAVIATRRAPAPSAPLTRTMIGVTATDTPVIDGVDRDVAITPDGRRVIYVGANGTRLFARAFDQLEAVPLTPPSGLVRGVFTSPDGQWVGYLENIRTLRKVSSTGGPPVTLAVLDGGSRGATWLADDSIVVALNSTVVGLLRVPASGGETTILTRPDPSRGEQSHLWPHALPDGKSVLFTIASTSDSLDDAEIAILDLASGKWRSILKGGHDAHYVASGHLVYGSGGTLRAVSFDLDRLEVRGVPTPVLQRLVTTSAGVADFSVGDNGTLVYLDAAGNPDARTFAWVDRQGREVAIGVPERPWASPRVSPDSRRMIFQSLGQGIDNFVWQFEEATLTRLTFGPEQDNYPEWTADGASMVYSSNRGGAPNLYLQSVNGGTAERLTSSPNMHYATGFTPDGLLLITERPPGQARDLSILRFRPAATANAPRTAGSNGIGAPPALLATPADEANATVSPDGQWMAYESGALGAQPEIYVRRFPRAADGQWQVSSGGGRQPVWAHSGRDLFFLGNDNAMMVVRVSPRGDSWSASNPRQLFGGSYVSGGGLSRQYDIAPDDQRFVMVKRAGGPPRIVVVQNWFQELLAKVPVH